MSPKEDRDAQVRISFSSGAAQTKGGGSRCMRMYSLESWGDRQPADQTRGRDVLIRTRLDAALVAIVWKMGDKRTEVEGKQDERL